jgi:hypothetical protein
MNIIVEIPNEKAKLARAIPIRPNKKELFLAGLEQSAKEVKSAIKGKKKLKTLEEALNEL